MDGSSQFPVVTVSRSTCFVSLLTSLCLCPHWSLHLECSFLTPLPSNPTCGTQLHSVAPLCLPDSQDASFIRVHTVSLAEHLSQWVYVPVSAPISPAGPSVA